MIQIYAHLSMSNEELAEAIAESVEDPEELLELFIRCDELIADLDFTQRLYARLGESIMEELGQ